MKITLKKFFKSKETLAIYCDTEEQARKLCNAFHEMGKKWDNNSSYLSSNSWNSNFPVYLNSNIRTTYKAAQENEYKIYEFEDVVFKENNTNKKDRETLMKVIKKFINYGLFPLSIILFISLIIYILFDKNEVKCEALCIEKYEEVIRHTNYTDYFYKIVLDYDYNGGKAAVRVTEEEYEIIKLGDLISFVRTDSAIYNLFDYKFKFIEVIT